MSETYTKLFSSITDSTIWAEDNETRIVWITMLAMADRSGYVGASIPGLAARAKVSITAVEKAIARFLSPDKYSRSQEFEGRRIEVADRGWNLLNYERFRDMRDEEARKEYERKRKRDQRAKARANQSRSVPDSPGQSRDVHAGPRLSAQAEAEAEAEAEGDSVCAASDKPDATPVVLTFPVKGKPSSWDLTRGQIETWLGLYPGVDVLAECRKALAWVAASPERRKTARGMGRFLVGWLGRSNDKRAPQARSFRDMAPLERIAANMAATEGWDE